MIWLTSAANPFDGETQCRLLLICIREVHASTNASRLSIACTKMQEACMWACRAVARPDADC
ncbi:TPA: hypothetical protein MI403_24980 [Klebsiella pneumoniae]|nr:hypothetical protein COO49_14465 [Klebsiella pneumoniae]HBX3908665.1 hypothetical protein [Klebsiella pneumoniae subsp. pneumoniae]RMA15513.1 hypothetical protein EA161_16085 [Klebsiella pneumoniae]RRY49228.1 hypothetical protein EGJ93_24900 [Klebsiella pneumoniae]RRY90148.1 hypothetical protein EGK01_24595 [Klebsiella pneumoniae]